MYSCVQTVKCPSHITDNHNWKSKINLWRIRDFIKERKETDLEEKDYDDDVNDDFLYCFVLYLSIHGTN